MRPMRRKDREITDPGKIQQILSSCHCCRLGLCDQGKAYIVPLNFGCALENGKYVLYFHGAQEGRKIDLIRETGWAGFEMDTGYQLNEADQACGYSAAFQSIIGGGKVSFIEDPEEKKKALCCIMAHNTSRSDWVFPEAALKATCVYKLEVEELSCKEHE